MKLAVSFEDLTLGAYLGAVQNVQAPQLRLPIGQIAANEAQHVSALAVSAGRPAIGSAFAPSLQIDAVSTALDNYETKRWRSSSTRRARQHRLSDQPRHPAPLGQGRSGHGGTRRAQPARRLGDRDRPAARRWRGTHLSARNRFKAVVTDVKVEGLMAQVEMVVTEPVRLVAIVTRDAVEELSLKNGMSATAVVKSTSVMVQL